jgi:hypothetical protein
MDLKSPIENNNLYEVSVGFLTCKALSLDAFRVQLRKQAKTKLVTLTKASIFIGRLI